MRDFFTILESQEWYNPAYHNKSNATYALFGNLVEFISVDMPTKIRGAKRNILFINECNELNLEDWRQLLLRTTDKIIIDYNPSDEFHWIYDEVLTREDADFYKTTYKDNPFLRDETIKEIERLKDADENYWRVYGLGERGASRATILTHWTPVDQIPDGWKLLAYGLDFGYTNDPSAIVAVYTDGEGIALDQILYATGLTNNRISEAMTHAGIQRGDLIIADNAEPKSIDEIHGHGFNIHPCRKGRDSIRSGIDYLRSRPLKVTARSKDIIKELRNYQWKEDKNGRQINEPKSGWDHAIDAARYAATWNQTNPNYRSYAIG